MSGKGSKQRPTNKGEFDKNGRFQEISWKRAFDEMEMHAKKAFKEGGPESVAVFSDADRHAQHVQQADIAVSLGGNAANESYLVAEKIIDLGGKVMALSDSSGSIYDPEGIDKDKLLFVKRLKNIKRGKTIKILQIFY